MDKTRKQQSINGIFFVFLFLSSCSPITPPTNTPEPSPTGIPQTLKTGYLKTSLEVIRNGKTYEVLIGYNPGGGWSYYSTPPAYPDWFKDAPQAPTTMLHWAADIDNDGEMEFIVQVLSCGGTCSSALQVYDYDSLKDEYRLFDQVYAEVSDYQDIEKDGKPEMIAKDQDFFIVIAAFAARAFAPILIYRYEQGKLTIVTRQYPQLVQKDAEHRLDGAKTDGWGQGDGNLLLASYLYDMYLLRKQDEGIKTFNEICSMYVKPKISNPEWSCDQYLVTIQKEILKAQANQ